MEIPLKEKALELIERHFKIFTSTDIKDYHDDKYTRIFFRDSKKHALICVDEKIKSLKPWEKYITGRGQIEDLKEVKQEIQNL